MSFIPSCLLTVVGLTILILTISYFARIGHNEAWNELAKQTGLTFKPATFSDDQRAVFGVYRQRQIRLETFKIRAGTYSNLTYTRIMVTLNQPGDLCMTLHEARVLFARISEKLGMSDIKIGDEDLDRRFVIQGQPENKIVRLLSSPEIRKQLRPTIDLCIKVEWPMITYTKFGVEVNPDTLIALFDLLCLMSDEIDNLQHSESIS
jgi:hypothetical protein